MSEIVYHILLCEVDEAHLKRDEKYIRVFSQQLGKRVEIHGYLYNGYEEFISQIHRESEAYDISVLSTGMDKSEDAFLMHVLKQTNVRMPIIKLPYGKCRKIRNESSWGRHLSAEEQYRERFRSMFQCAMERAECGNDEKEFLQLVINKKRIYLRMNSIIWLEKRQKKICYKTWNNCFEERNTIQNVEGRLPDYFMRVSQSAVINMNEIVSIEGYNIIMTTEDEFFIGRTYLEKVRMKYMQFVK